MNALTPWQQQAADHVQAALLAGRLGHGLLITGPTGIGKRALALHLARQLLCAGDPVAAARSAQLLDAGTHPDLQLVSFIPNKSGDKLRTEIVIEQIRQVSQKLALTAQYGQGQVVIIDPAEAINTSAANALLKTLEEPAPGRYLWLLASEPARLPATIRSRCQVLELRLPPRAQALDWLLSQGHDADVAGQALEAARGHPGLADNWLRGEGWALRGQVRDDLDGLAAGRVQASELAVRWSGDEHLALRLRHAADLALLRARHCGLTAPAGLPKLAAWFDAANTTASLLRTTIRADLAVVELLLAWPAAIADASKGKKQ